MRSLLKKGLSVSIVLMMILVIFTGISTNTLAKGNGSVNGKQIKSGADSSSIPMSIQPPVDMEAPEAVIYFDFDTKRIEIYGTDDSGEDVYVRERTIEEGKREKIVVYTLINQTGKTLALTLAIKNSNSKESSAAFEVIEMRYNLNKPIVFNKNDVKFVVKYKNDRTTGRISDLMHNIDAAGQFTAKLHYQTGKDVTTIQFNENERDQTKFDVGGLGRFNFITDKGGFTLSLVVNGIEEQISGRAERESRIDPSQLAAYENLIGNSAVPPVVRFGDFSGVPEYLSGRWATDPTIPGIGDKAVNFIETYGGLFRLDTRTDSLSISEVTTSRLLGFTNVKLQQEYRGIPVFGGELIVHIDRGGNVIFANGNFAAGIKEGTTARITSAQAQDTAVSELKNNLPGISIEGIDTPVLSIYNTGVLNRYSEGTNVLVWSMIIKTKDPIGVWYYMVNAENGMIVEAWNNYKSESMNMPWSGLLYLRQSGAISEAHNIIMAETPDIKTAFSNPIWQGERDHMDDFLNFNRRCDINNDNCGVTTNSAIITKLILLMAYGGAHYGISTDGIGVEKTRLVLLATLNDGGVTCSATFNEYRNVMLEVSDRLVGNGLCAADSSNIKNIWISIGFLPVKQTLTSDTPEPLDMYGWSLARGDFNNDTYEDLAVGVPFEDYEYMNDGVVMIYYGCGSGLKTSGSECLTQDLADAGNKALDYFGWSLAAGDFNGDSYDDLAVGAPRKNFDGKTDSGKVIIFYGGKGGLIPDPIGDPPVSPSPETEILSQGLVGSLNENDDNFGWSLTVGNFDNDSFDDLAVGVPYENYFTLNDGIVVIFYGTAYGMLPEGFLQ
jgi:hypothetical protein